MNTIGLGNQYETVDFKKEYEYDKTKWKETKIDFDRKLTYESTDSWIGLDENNNKVRLSDTKPSTIYVTTKEIDINIQFGNDDHILSYWGNNKEKIDNLLEKQIDEDNIIESKKELTLIGDFKQDSGVLFAQYNSKYKPFRDEFPKKTELKRRKKLIDVQKPFRLEFKSADIIGEQYKVLNDTNSVIIDGSAGTGKSTIALQKLKYLELNKKVPQEKMLVIVKNKQVISHFRTLLEDKELLLNDVELKEVSSFLSSIYPNLGDITKDYLMEINKKSSQIRKNIEKSIKELNLENLTNHLAILFNDINSEIFIKSIIKIIDDNKRLIEKITKDISLYNSDIKEKLDILIYKKEKIEQKNKRYEKALNSLSNREVDTLSIEILKEIADISTNKKIQALYWIKKYILDLKNLEKNKDNYEKLEEKLYKSFKKNKNEIDNFKNILQNICFTEQFILDNYLMNFTNIEKDLILNYIFSKKEKGLDTIIVDEAQDYTLVELELLRFQANRIILTGDILQNIKDNEIREWTDILNIDDVYQAEDRNGEERLNIFTLKHNYRQTYQLSNASYNLRQLILKRELENIEKEYWVSEKEFNGKPYSLPLIIFNQNIELYINKKIEYIKNTFTSQIPIVLVYKTNEEKESYQQELKDYRLSYDTEKIENIDVILIDILEAKGKQFPVVVSSLDGLSDREIYLIMTRGQFEVEFLSSKQEVDNNYLKILKEKKWIETKGVKFISEKTPKKSVNSGKDEESKSKDSSQSSKPNNDKVSEDEEVKPTIKEQTSKDKEKPKSTDDNASSSESIKNDLLDAKRKHEGEIKEIEIELNPTVIQDIEAYIKKAQKEYEENLKNAPTNTTTHIVTRNVKVGRKETKWFLEKQYQGLCQICGFTFTKRKQGAGQYFELFDWFSEKITKQKVKIVQAGSSLSLCARCHAGVKYGSFKTNLVDILEKLDVKSMSFDEFVSKISITVENKEIPMCYDFIENDMYKVDIRLFNKEEFIFYTEEHFMHLFVMLRSRGEL